MFRHGATRHDQGGGGEKMFGFIAPGPVVLRHMRTGTAAYQRQQNGYSPRTANTHFQHLRYLHLMDDNSQDPAD